MPHANDEFCIMGIRLPYTRVSTEFIPICVCRVYIQVYVLPAGRARARVEWTMYVLRCIISRWGLGTRTRPEGYLLYFLLMAIYRYPLFIGYLVVSIGRRRVE